MRASPSKGLHGRLPGNRNRPGTGQCSAAASSGFSRPNPSLAAAWGWHRGPSGGGPDDCSGDFLCLRPHWDSGADWKHTQRRIHSKSGHSLGLVTIQEQARPVKKRFHFAFVNKREKRIESSRCRRRKSWAVHTERKIWVPHRVLHALTHGLPCKPYHDPKRQAVLFSPLKITNWGQRDVNTGQFDSQSIHFLFLTYWKSWNTSDIKKSPQHPFIHHPDLVKKNLFAPICLTVLNSSIKANFCCIWLRLFLPCLDPGFLPPFLPRGTIILPL